MTEEEGRIVNACSSMCKRTAPHMLMCTMQNK